MEMDALGQGGEIDAKPVIMLITKKFFLIHPSPRGEGNKRKVFSAIANCILKCTKPAAGMQGECQKRQAQMSQADLCH